MLKVALQERISAALTPASRELASIIWPERRMLLKAVACAILGPGAAMAVPFAAKLIIDEVIGRGRGELLLPIALGAALAILIQALTTYGVTQAGAVAGHRVVSRLRQRLQRHALRLPVRYFDRTPTGTLVSRLMSDVDQARILFGQGLLELVSGMITAALAFAVLLWLDWRLTALVALALGFVAAGLARGFGLLDSAFRAVSELQASLAGRLTEVFGGIRVVKSCSAERREVLAFARDNHRMIRVSIEAHRHVAVLAAVITLAGGGVSLGLLVAGGRAVARGGLTLGDLALFLFLVGLLSAPVMQVAAAGSELGRAAAALGRLREVLALSTEEAQDRGKLPVPRVKGSVRCDDVSYAYFPGHLVLSHVSLHAPAGATLAILGPNGAGKSTLLSLLAGFDDPSSGRILIDGSPLTALARVDYRRHLAVVLQRDQLIDGTIAENIRYGRPGASAAEFRRAARLAHCDEFVGQLPAGYETTVGERGLRLSGGQRQRVAIARALLAAPQILLLDEVTNQLDSESEALIQDALGTLRQDRTTFIIAHRLTTAQAADEILVLEAGTVVERGIHDALLLGGGRYARLSGTQNQTSGGGFPGWTTSDVITPTDSDPRSRG
jgi:ABC-type multidrug transport system fused ATPase/permease subunit